MVHKKTHYGQIPNRGLALGDSAKLKIKEKVCLLFHVYSSHCLSTLYYKMSYINRRLVLKSQIIFS